MHVVNYLGNSSSISLSNINNKRKTAAIGLAVHMRTKRQVRATVTKLSKINVRKVEVLVQSIAGLALLK